MDPTDYTTNEEDTTFLASGIAVVQAVIAAVAIYAAGNYHNQPYHDSALSGQAWVEELKSGHPDRIHHELGVWLYVFYHLIAELELQGFTTSWNGVTVDEQLAIFLYTYRTGLSVWHMGEHFQCSNETVAW